MSQVKLVVKSLEWLAIVFSFDLPESYFLFEYSLYYLSNTTHSSLH